MNRFARPETALAWEVDWVPACYLVSDVLNSVEAEDAPLVGVVLEAVSVEGVPISACSTTSPRSGAPSSTTFEPGDRRHLGVRRQETSRELGELPEEIAVSTIPLPSKNWAPPRHLDRSDRASPRRLSGYPGRRPLFLRRGGGGPGLKRPASFFRMSARSAFCAQAQIEISARCAASGMKSIYLQCLCVGFIPCQ